MLCIGYVPQGWRSSPSSAPREKGRDMSRRTLYLPALIVAAGLMVCAAAVLAASKEAEATFPGKNGNIAYTRLDGTDFEIYTIPPTGGAPTSLTNNGADDS